MTGSSEKNMESVAQEVNQMEADYGKNLKILRPNDQIRGEICQSTFLKENFMKEIKFQNFKRSSVIKTRREATLNFMLIDSLDLSLRSR